MSFFKASQFSGPYVCNNQGQHCPFCKSAATFCWFAPTKRLALTALFEPVEWCWPGLMTQMRFPVMMAIPAFLRSGGSGY